MKAKYALSLLACALSLSANAATVYYQPTPYPLKKSDGSVMPQDLNNIHIHDGWLGSVYNTTFTRDDKLRAGGWGDTYRSYVNFDLIGLPQNPTNAILWLRSYPSGSAQTPFQFCIPNSSWDTTVTWSTQPTFLGCTTSYYTPPTTDNWMGWYITSWYQNWQNGIWAKDGLMINPQYTDNKFDNFRSSRYSSDGYRPILQFDFTSTFDLKMPLPGAHSWLVTTETGGYDCKGSFDQYHSGSNYFSIDFSWRNNPDSGATNYYESSNIPVIAAAGGTANVFYSDPNNGNYVVVTHGSTGFTTRYLHLDTIAVSDGSAVSQGGTLGYMGNTGLSSGKHLHFGVRYNNSGASSVPELTKVVMDGWILKSFQTECSVDGSGVPTDWIRYYRSGNTVY